MNLVRHRIGCPAVRPPRGRFILTSAPRRLSVSSGSPLLTPLARSFRSRLAPESEFRDAALPHAQASARESNVRFVASGRVSRSRSRANPVKATGHIIWLNVDAAGLQLISRQGIHLGRVYQRYHSVFSAEANCCNRPCSGGVLCTPHIVA